MEFKRSNILSLIRKNSCPDELYIHLDAPFILNSIKKLAVVENRDITTECIVDAHPKADITWFGPSGQRLSSFAEEKVINSTVISSQLHCKFTPFFFES